MPAFFKLSHARITCYTDCYRQNDERGDFLIDYKKLENPPIRTVEKSALGTKVCTKQTFASEQFRAIIKIQENRESIENTGFFIGAVAKW